MRQIFIASVLPAPDSPEMRIDCALDQAAVGEGGGDGGGGEGSGEVEVGQSGCRVRPTLCDPSTPDAGRTRLRHRIAHHLVVRLVDERVDVRRQVRARAALVLRSDRLRQETARLTGGTPRRVACSGGLFLQGGSALPRRAWGVGGWRHT